MTPVALAFAVLSSRHGQGLLGYVMAAELVPHILLLLVGGSVADRYRRDRLIMLASVGSGLSQAGIAIVVLTGQSPYWIFPLAVMNGMIGAFTSPAMRGIVPELVDHKDIQKANGLLNTSRGASRIVGPAVAGILAAMLGGGWGIALDSLSFFIAALCMSQVEIASHPQGSRDSLVHQMREGWEYFRGQRWIWSITGAWAVMNALQMGAWQVLGPIIARHTFGPAGWGMALSVRAVGLLMASGVMMRRTLARPLCGGMLSAVTMGIPMVVLGRGLALPYLIMATMVAGAGAAISGIAWDTSLQQGVPRDKLSRVMAWDDFGSYAMIPLGEILAVPMAHRWGFGPVDITSGVLLMVMALTPISLRAVRQMTSQDLREQACYEQAGN